MLDTITSVLDYSRELSFSSLDNVRDIRTSGQETLKSIHTSEEMTQSEKADALREAAQLLTEYLNPEPFDREYRALQYVIRILKARESIIRDTIDTLSEFMTNDADEVYNSAPMSEDDSSYVSDTLKSSPITPMVPIVVISGEVVR
jgi:hypothetical protein